MQRKLSTLNKYPLDQSPLFKLSNKKRLANLLRITPQGLQELLDKNNNYKVFSIEKRIVEEPKKTLRSLHERLRELLSRIKSPDYLHSAVKKRSYITNAQIHINGRQLVKLDVEKFYPSTKFQHVFTFFKNVMRCSIDISTILTKVSTHDDHLPTGSPLSPILGFYAHMPMFDQIHQIAVENNVTFTCYVDDLSFSGFTTSGPMLFKIKRLIRKYDLKTHKEKKYAGEKFKEVTGVGIKGSKLLLPNRRHKKISDLMSESIACQKPSLKDGLLGKLIGRLSEADQINSDFKNKRVYLLGLKRRKEKNN